MKLKQLEIENKVDYALRNIRYELLPEEIRRDNLTNWILSFDTLEKTRNKRDFFEYDQDDFLASFISQITHNSLTPNISFYFSSLFHIGRQWQVSEQVVNSIESSMEYKNLNETLKLNKNSFNEIFQELGIKSQDYNRLLSDSFSNILSFAKQQHLKSIKLSQNWWSMWKTEVRSIKDMIGRCSSEYNEYRYKDRYRMAIPRSLLVLTTYSFQTHKLYNSLAKEGIRFKNINIQTHIQSPFIDPTFLTMFFMLSIPQKDFEFEYRHFIHDFEHLLRSQEELLETQRLTPIIQQAELHLLKLFEKGNPFEKYDMLISIPDKYLRELWNKCKLPQKKTFYYAENWINSLESKPDFWCRELPFKSELNKSDIENYARSADSTIKRKFVSESTKVGYNDIEFIQVLFENEWVVEMVKGAVYPTKKKKGSQKWSVNNFYNMLEKVILFLNEEVGYNIEIASKNRLQKLWDLVIKGKTYDIKW